MILTSAAKTGDAMSAGAATAATLPKSMAESLATGVVFTGAALCRAVKVDEAIGRS